MPLPLIPILLGGASLIAGGYGVKKGFDAKENFKTAESIGEKAKRRHEKAVSKLEKAREETNQKFVQLGELKVAVFANQIKFLVDELKKRKDARSSLKNFEQLVEELNLPQMEKMVLGSLEIEKGLASGTVSGALMGLGAYGSVGMLASASTGTAIASLSGAAATNATLAWLGGGALSAGGLGMAGGTAVLGGLVAGPAIAITGFVIASKAEEALSEARRYEATVDEAIEGIKVFRVGLDGLQKNADEIGRVINELAEKFDQCRSGLDDSEDAFWRMVRVGRSLKEVLNTAIMEKDGAPVKNLASNLKVATSGFVEYAG